ncbi:hypothetical protein ACIQMJ_31430 [Actinosynnema sp. NPDC091369]
MNRPPITPEMRARARTTPNAWLHVVDPNHRVSTAIPPAEAVIGRYLVDSRGEITDQYVPNPRYRPAPPTAAPSTTSATAPPTPTRPAAPAGAVPARLPTGSGAATAGRPAPAHPVAPPGVAPPGPPAPARPTGPVGTGPMATTPSAPAHPAGSVAAEPPAPALPSAPPNPAPPRATAPPAPPGAAASAPVADQPAEVEPANELEAVLRLVHQGELAQDDLLPAVLAAELVLPADPARPPRGHLVTRGAVVDAFASPKALPGDWPPRWHRFTGVELAVVFDRLGEPLRLNLADSSGLSWDIASDALVRALRSAVGAG